MRPTRPLIAVCALTLPLLVAADAPSRRPPERDLAQENADLRAYVDRLEERVRALQEEVRELRRLRSAQPESRVIPDRPGELAHIVGLIAAQRANVLAIQHHREGRNIGVLETEAELTLETRDEEHSQVVIRELAEAGYAVRRLR